jgi:hypothetical protein
MLEKFLTLLTHNLLNLSISSTGLPLYRPFNPKAASNESFGKPRYAVYVLPAKGEPKGIDLGDAEIIQQTLVQLRDDLRDKDTPKKIARQPGTK